MSNLTIRGGVFPALMTTLKKAANGADGKADSISGPELKKAMKSTLAGIKDRYDGASSEAGLAALRNALVKTFKAADKNWTISSGGYKVAREMLGAKLDGKGGELARLEAAIRSEVRGPTVRPYGGGGGGGGGSFGSFS
ncbi:MAG: hypothetical protein JNK82_34395 [Myxococcaceae bacterium]|nr:hypothetical protein [Myxococcaceae bacterium]